MLSSLRSVRSRRSLAAIAVVTACCAAGPATAGASVSVVWTRFFQSPCTTSNPSSSGQAVAASNSEAVVTGVSHTSTCTQAMRTNGYGFTGTNWGAWLDPSHFGPSSGWDVAASPDGNHFFVAGADELNQGMVVAYSASGVKEWLTSTPATTTNQFVAVSPDGKTVFAAGGGLITAFDAAAGTPLWSDFEQATAVGLTVSATQVFLEAKGVNPKGIPSFVTTAYNSTTGATIWRSYYAGATTTGSVPDAITTNGAVVFVTGQSADATTHLQDWATVAYAAGGGGQIWGRRYADGASDVASSIVLAPNGSRVYVSGSGTTSTGSQELLRTIAYSSSGSLLWIRVRGGGTLGIDGTASHSAVNNATGEVYIVAPAGTPGGEAFYTVAYSSDGTLQWTKAFIGPDMSAYPEDLAAMPNGGAVVATGFVQVKAAGGGSETDYATVAYAG